MNTLTIDSHAEQELARLSEDIRYAGPLSQAATSCIDMSIIRLCSALNLWKTVVDARVGKDSTDLLICVRHPAIPNKNFRLVCKDSKLFELVCDCMLGKRHNIAANIKLVCKYLIIREPITNRDSATCLIALRECYD